MRSIVIENENRHRFFSGVKLVLPTVVAAATLSLVATACGPNNSVGLRGDATGPAISSIAALPSLPPEKGLEAGGGGTTGGSWPVYGMPGAGSADDEGISPGAIQQAISGGVTTKLTALPGEKSYRWAVRDATVPDAGDQDPIWDSGDISVAGKGKKKASAGVPDSCSVTSKAAYCVVPKGILSVGGSYLVATTAGSQTETRMFSVVDQVPVSGSSDVSFANQTINTAYGNFGLGLHFNTANQGVTPETEAKGGFQEGLPPGWSWSGLPGDLSSIAVTEAGSGGYQGYDKVLSLQAGSNTILLGCKDTKIGEQCTQMIGPMAGAGYIAHVAEDGPITVTDQSGMTNWQFDDKGRVTNYYSPGQWSLEYSYRDDSKLFDKIKFGSLEWSFYYSGDKECQDGSLPSGFVETPEGYVCAFDSPAGEWQQIVYTQPEGATVPRISRVLQAPDSCKWDFTSCEPMNVAIIDLGWDANNRPFVKRDSLNTWGIVQGSLQTGYDATSVADVDQAASDPTLTWATYDSEGRLDTVKTPAPKHLDDLSKAVRSVSKRTYVEGSDVASKFKGKFSGSLRVVQTATSSSDGKGGTQTTSNAFDAANRGVYSLSPTGSLSEIVWHPVAMNASLATITSSSAQSSVYNNRGVMTSQYTAPIAAFDLKKCSADAPGSDLMDADVCKPTDLSQAVQREIAYDQVTSDSDKNSDDTASGSLLPGLTVLWFDNPNYAGNPKQLANVEWSTGDDTTSPGFPVSPPEGIGSQFGVRYNGSVKVKKADYDVTVSTTDKHLEGVLRIDGQSPCIIDDGHGTCSFKNDTGAYATSDPVSLVLNLTRESSDDLVPGTVSIKMEDEDAGETVKLSTANFVDRSGVATTATVTDPLPKSAATAYRSALKKNGVKQSKVKGFAKSVKGLGDSAASIITSFYNFGDVMAGPPTSTKSVGTSATTGNSSESSPLVQTFEGNGLGGTRVKTETVEGADSGYEYSYWSDTDTPSSSGLSNLDEIPDYLKDQPQYGQQKTLQDPTGRQINLIYDEYGAEVCRRTARSEDDSDAHWTCWERDEAYRLLSRTNHAADKAEMVKVEYAVQWGTRLGDPVATMVSTMVTGSDDSTKQTQISSTDALQRTVAYTDAKGTLSETEYDAFGRILKLSTTPAPNAEGQVYDANVTQYQYSADIPLLKKVLINGQEAASVDYYGANNNIAPNSIKHVDYLSGFDAKISMDKEFPEDASGGSETWNFADGKIRQSQYTTVGGTAVSGTFNDINMTYQYDGQTRLTSAQIGDHHFTYGWDDQDNKTCVAVDISNPGGDKKCADLDGAVQIGYQNERPVSVSDPQFEIPSNPDDAFTSNGYLKQLGSLKLSYDVAGQLAVAEDDQTGSRQEWKRDAQGRAIEQSAAGPAEEESAAPEEEEAAAPEEPSSEQIEASQGEVSVRGEGEDPSPDTPTVVGYGYSSAGGVQTVSYTQDGPVSIYGLPGGVQVVGSKMVIPGMNGPVSTIIDDWSSSKIADSPLNVTGPFGEIIKDKADKDVSEEQLAAPYNQLADHGSRTWVAQIGIMLQPDPSFYPGTTQYGGVGTDPINYSDPNGFGRKDHSMPQWTQVLFTLLGTIVGMFFTQMLQRKAITGKGWFKAMGPEGQRAFLFVFYAGMTAAVDVGIAAATSGGDLKKTWGMTWNLDSLLMTASGFFGAYASQAAGAVDSLQTQAMSKIGELAEGGQAVLKSAEGVGANLMEKVEKYEGTATRYIKNYAQSEVVAMAARAVGGDAAYYGTKALWAIADPEIWADLKKGAKSLGVGLKQRWAELMDLGESLTGTGVPSAVRNASAETQSSIRSWDLGNGPVTIELGNPGAPPFVMVPELSGVPGEIDSNYKWWLRGG